MSLFLGTFALVSCNQASSTNSSAETPTDEAAPPPSDTLVAPGKVLMVIANQHFFYQEYADPKAALEAEGFTVEVASGNGAPSTPHAGTGQPDDDPVGTVTPDWDFTEINVADYQALVIVGGWGASRYYFGYLDDFAGNSINEAAYQPDPTDAGRLNSLIEEFLQTDRYVMGICNGVNVLSWARVDGVSPLSGKSVSAPYLGVPAQTYRGNNHINVDPCTTPGPGNCLQMKTFAEDNGASVASYNSVGNPASNEDDVSVDGQIITVQDNFAAFAGGEELARQILGE